MVVLGESLGDGGHGGQVAAHLGDIAQEQEQDWKKSGAETTGARNQELGEFRSRMTDLLPGLVDLSSGHEAYPGDPGQ